MRNSQIIWDINARRYGRFMRKDTAACERLCELPHPVVQENRSEILVPVGLRRSREIKGTMT